MIVLAFDLATTTGWAYGEPGATPIYGSKRFGSKGASLPAKAWHAERWLREMLNAVKPGLVVYEAPMPTGRTIGKTRTETTTTLHGLIWQLGAITHGLNYFQLESASILAVRNHFLGTCDLERKSGKLKTIDICYRLGFEPADDNAADAIALWHYRCSKEEPSLALQTAPLFMPPAAEDARPFDEDNVRRRLNRNTVTSAGFGRLRLK
jgi:hypothetical protein